MCSLQLKIGEENSNGLPFTENHPNKNEGSKVKMTQNKNGKISSFWVKCAPFSSKLERKIPMGCLSRREPSQQKCRI
jgi:hypothetical protein